MKEKIEAFKNELRNLNFYIREKENLKNKIEIEYYRLENVTAVNPEKQPGTTNEEYLHEKRNEAYERIGKLKKELEEIQLKINAINKILNKMEKEKRNIITEIFVDKKSSQDICDKMFISKSTLYYQINSWIEKVME